MTSTLYRMPKSNKEKHVELPKTNLMAFREGPAKELAELGVTRVGYRAYQSSKAGYKSTQIQLFAFTSKKILETNEKQIAAELQRGTKILLPEAADTSEPQVQFGTRGKRILAMRAWARPDSSVA